MEESNLAKMRLARWRRKFFGWVTFGLAMIAGFAGLLSELHNIGEFFGLTKGEDPLKLELRLTTVAMGATEAVRGDISFLFEVTKSGADAARNCKIDINLDGSKFSFRNTNYGTVFSLPAGRVVREIIVELIPFPDSFVTRSKARGAILCDNASSEEMELRCSAPSSITKRAHC
jgi:hypothetical protein